MAYQNKYPNMNPYMFKEPLDPKDRIISQIRDFQNARNEGDYRGIVNALAMLEDFITPEVLKTYEGDKESYAQDIQKLDDELKKDWRKEDREYKRKLIDAVCVDVVAKPTRRIPSWYYQKKFRLILALLERKGLWLKKKQKDTL